MKRRSARGAIIAVILLGFLIFGLVYFAWNTAAAIFQPVDAPRQGRDIPIQIHTGETTTVLANDLQAKGLIRNALAFRLWARIKGLDVQLPGGEYNHLNTSMTISDIIDQLLTTSPDAVYVTIPEGYRIEQIARAFAEAGLVKFNQQDFLKYALHPNKFPDASKYPILKLIPRGHSMEGLLFPATYDIPIDGTTGDVLNRMLTAFDDYAQKYGLVATARAHGVNEYQMVILASIIQREILHSSDAPGVAGVYWNRAFSTVHNDTAGFLGADPTVQYARDTENPPKEYWLPLAGTGKNIAPNSPWNTYTFKGLPPTPICSPGLATLQAAASPAKSNYFYFFNTKSGSVVYATTYNEFLQKYNSMPH